MILLSFFTFFKLNINEFQSNLETINWYFSDSLHLIKLLGGRKEFLRENFS